MEQDSAHVTGPAIDVLGVLRGCIGAVVGVEDWDVSRMHEATELVVYVFEGRAAAQGACRHLKRTRDMRLADVDGHFAPGFEIELGTGKAPSTVARYPIKVRVLAEHGLAHDPILAFERAVDIIEREAWDEHPGARPPPRPGRRASAGRGEGSVEEEAYQGGHLGASPRMDPDGSRGYSEPLFQVEVQGYERRINPNKYGIGRDGLPVLGRRWVDTYHRYKDKPPPPGKEAAPVDEADEVPAFSLGGP